MPDPKRYAIKGRRPGETYHTPFGIVATDAIDGGARLKPDQKKYFETEYGLIEVAAVPPEPEPPPIDRLAQARIAENNAVGAAQAEDEQRLRAAQEANAAAKAAAEKAAAEAEKPPATPAK